MKTFVIITIIFFAFINNGSIAPVTPYLRPLATRRLYDRLHRQPSERIKSDEARTRLLSNDDDDEGGEAYYDSKSVNFNYNYYHSDGYSTITINDSNQLIVSDNYHYWQWWVWVIVVILGVASLWCIRKCMC